DQPPPIEFQHRANFWLRRLHELAGALRPTPISVSDINQFFFDALRSQLNLHNGLVLGRLNLTRAILARHPRGEVQYEGEDSVGHLGIAEIASLLGEGRITRTRRQMAKRILSDLHMRAYQQKLWVQRKLRQWRREEPSWSPGAGQPVVLAFPRQAGHVADLIPIAHDLRRLSGAETVFLVTSEAIKERC